MSTAVVVGGGPAGLIAAEELARAGVRVTVYEHKPSVGRKLLLAGRGGLNLTHSEDGAAFLGRYGESVDRMRPLLDSFDPTALREWCAGLGEPTFVGSSGRVFPQSFRATPLLRAWLGRLATLGVTIETRRRWVGWVNAAGGGRAMRFESPDGRVTDVAADVVVFALGGASWPRVGSDGGWVRAFTELGVAVTPLRAANAGVRVVWSQRFADRFEGTPLKYVGLSLTTWDAPTVRGDAMVTRTGLEGGPVYALGSAIRDAVDTDGRCGLAIDLHPDLTVTALADRLSRRRPKESTSTWLRRAIGLAPVSIGLLREATAGDLPVDPAVLAALVKAVPVLISAVMPIDRAISTAGGIAWSEVDGALMLRRLPGTFVAGEMLDWEAPTGGYLLQGSFSTGVAAARGALAWLDR
jgi:uncharacterized flavoprotein (TIGR03862 family)